ncbi:hypothetical protein [Brevundimonas denitrificans]
MTDIETLDALPLIAILRGLTPEEAPAVGAPWSRRVSGCWRSR